MLSHFYVLDDQQPELHRILNDEEMQEFVINLGAMEGVLYHSEMARIKILYNTHSGEVKLVDTDSNPNINFDYSDVFESQRRLVELAIRRLIKLELLYELNRMKDDDICGVIKRHHEIDPATEKLCSNTSEIALNLTLVKIINLGYPMDAFSLRRFFSLLRKRSQTQVQKAIYAAFEDIKKEHGPGIHILDQFKSRNVIQRFRDYIKKNMESSLSMMHKF